MLKKFINLILVLCIFTISNSSAMSQEQGKTFKYVTVKDKQTLAEFARTVVPEDFNVSSEIIWERNFETPVTVDVFAVSPDKNVTFEYSSQKTFVDTFQKKYRKIREIDSVLRVTKKHYEPADEYVREIIKTQNPDATDIHVDYTQTFSDEVKTYLMSEYYKKVEDLKVDAKTDRRSTRTVLSNPAIEPYMATFSYKAGKTSYKQTFITLFSSLDYDYTKKTSYDVYQKFNRKLWTISEMYSYKAEKDLYDKYYDDFMVFVLNSLINKKAAASLHLVKQQMKMELNPSFVDVHTGSSLKNMPSDLFKRYIETGKPSYSEDKKETVITPSAEQSKWIANIAVPQSKYLFKTKSAASKQSLYVDKKYKNVYFNKKEQKFIIDQNPQVLERPWKQLKERK